MHISTLLSNRAFFFIIKEKRIDIFYLVAAFVYFILFALIIFIEDLKTYMNSDEFYYFIYYIYSFLLCYLLKKNIEQRNPHIDKIKTHKFDIYLLAFISFNIFFIWLLLYIANIYQNYNLFYIYIFIILFVVSYQKFIYSKSKKLFKFLFVILNFLIFLFIINEKRFYALIEQDRIKNIKIIMVLYIIILPLIIFLDIYASSNLLKLSEVEKGE